MSEVKHTPLPWETPTDVGPYKSSTIIRGANGQALIIIDPGRIRDLPYEEMVANSEFIVRACNAHYEMLEALEYLNNACDLGVEIEQAQVQALVAIAKAKATGQ